MMGKRIAVAAVVLGVAGAMAAFALPPEPEPQGRDASPWMGCGRCPGGARSDGAPARVPRPDELARVGLAADQIQAVRQFAYEQQQKRIDLEAATAKAELTLRHLMDSPHAGEEAVMAAVDALNGARGELFRMEILSALKLKQLVGGEVLRRLHEPPRPPELGPMERSEQEVAPGRPEGGPHEGGGRPPEERRR